MQKFKNLLALFASFFKIGLITFGGGYAMIAIIESELVEKKKWIEKNEFLDVIAIAESTPGPIAINSATFIGYKRGGFWGSLFATLGVVMPSFIVIFAISFFFEKFLSLEYVGYAFKGIQVCVAYLILSAGIKMFKGLKKNAFNIVLFGLAVAVMVTLDILAVSFSSVYYILIGGAVGIIVYLITFAKDKKEKKLAAQENEKPSPESALSPDENAVISTDNDPSVKTEGPEETVGKMMTDEKEDKE